MAHHDALHDRLFGWYIWDGNRSFDVIRKGQRISINVPTIDLINEVVGIGDRSGVELGRARRCRNNFHDRRAR